MAYGTVVKRSPARPGNIEEADLYRIGLLGKTRRGIRGIQRDIFTSEQFITKCGGYDPNFESAYIIKDFYDTLLQGVNVETLVLSHVADDAAQASLAVADTGASPEDIWSIGAGLKGTIDESKFGNDIAIKVELTRELSSRLRADVAATATSAPLDTVDHYQVGYFVEISDGTNTEVRKVSAVDSETGEITFSALTNAYAAADSIVRRIDVSLSVGVKDETGRIVERENYSKIPFTLSATEGIAEKTNDPYTGSNYIIVTVNDANGNTESEQLPEEITDWALLSGGSDGTDPIDVDWKNLVEDFATNPQSEFAFLFAPESDSLEHHSNMLKWATDGDKCMYYVNVPIAANDELLQNYGGFLRKPTVFGMIPGDKAIDIDDPLRPGQKRQISSIGMAAAHWFNTYAQQGVSKVAAGNDLPVNTNARIIDNGIVHDDRLGQGERLIRNYSVNIMKSQRGQGITINSARTLSTDRGYRYQNQVMQFLLYKRSIREFLKLREQHRGGETTRQGIYDEMWAYGKTQFDAGHLFRGKKPDGSDFEFKEVWRIVNDFTVNSLDDIANGKLRHFLDFVTTVPVEEQELNLQSLPVTSVRG